MTEKIIIKVKICPNSSKNEIIKEDGFLKIKVTAQPIENKANLALIKLLSKEFKIPKTSIEIIKGETSKEKLVSFSTQDKIKIDLINSYLTK